MKTNDEIELPDILFTEDNLIDFFYEKREGKEKYDRQALLEVWYCFKEYLLESMKSDDIRIVLYRDLIMQRGYDVESLVSTPMWLNDNKKVAYLMDKYFKIKSEKNIKNPPFKEE